MAVKPFRFSVPGTPPSVNHMYQQVERRTATGVTKAVKKEDSVAEYQTLAAMCARLARPKNWSNEYVEGEYIRISYVFTLSRHADCDNLMKALNDAVANALQVDDKWFLPCVERKVVNPKAQPGVDISISPGDSHGH